MEQLGVFSNFLNFTWMTWTDQMERSSSLSVLSGWLFWPNDYHICQTASASKVVTKNIDRRGKGVNSGKSWLNKTFAMLLKTTVKTFPYSIPQQKTSHFHSFIPRRYDRVKHSFSDNRLSRNTQWCNKCLKLIQKTRQENRSTIEYLRTVSGHVGAFPCLFLNVIYLICCD